MRKFILLLSLLCLSWSDGATQTNNKYLDEWSEIYKLENEDLPRSVIDEVSKVLQKAISEKNTQQTIKALLYKNKHKRVIDSEDNIAIFSDLSTLLSQTDSKADKALLYSMLAELYGEYNSRYGWRNRSRTSLSDHVPEDMRTWPENIFQDKIVECLDMSVADADALKKYTTKEYEDIIFLGEDAQVYYPTLYDFLMDRAIDLLRQNRVYQENYRKYESPYTEDILHVPANEFIKIDFGGENKYIIYKYYQQYLKDLMDRNMTSTIILAELEKMEYVKNVSYYKSEDKTIDFTNRLFEKYRKNDDAVEIIISIVENIQKTSLPSNEALEKKYEWCLRVKQEFPNSSRIPFFDNELDKMQNPFLDIEMDRLQYPGKEITMKVRHRNLQVLDSFPTLKIYKYVKEDSIFVKEIPMNYISAKSYIEEEVKCKLTEGLDSGKYAILYNIKSEQNGRSIYNRLDFRVSRLTSFSRNNNKHGYEVYVVDRMTGLPVEDATVSVYIRNENRSNKKKVLRTLSTDRNGLAEFKNVLELNSDEGFDGRYSVTSGMDTLYVDQRVDSDWRYRSSYQDDTRIERQLASIFTDRSIYRPGQTVYFKAILVRQDSSLVVGQGVDVELFDANQETIETKELKTNEFGSVSGEFILPKTGLSGEYRISVDNDIYYFKVEEYKRPTFEITFDKVKETYAFGKKVTVTGYVKNYSGMPLGNLNVEYTLSARRFIPWGYHFDDNKLKMDTVKTKEDGSFSIEFFPQETDIDIPLERVFSNKKSHKYHIEASVTDLNGETQESEFSMAVGNVSMLLELDIPEKIEKSDSPNLSIKAKNTNGETIKTSGTYHIYELNERDSIQRQVLDGKFETGDQLDLFQQLRKLKSGKYRILVKALDNDSEEVEDNKDFIIFSYKDKRPPIEGNNWRVVKNSTFSPKKDAEFVLGVTDQNVRVIYQLYDGKTVLKKEYLTLSNENKLFKVPYKKEYGDKIYAVLTYVKYGHFYNESFLLEKEKEPVDKNLTVKLETFRDKLRPGQEETWTLSVKDSNGNPAVAEVLASMYDKSLDQIYEGLEWHFALPHVHDGIPSIYYQYANFNKTTGNRRINLGYVLHSNSNVFYRTFDKLNWFGLIRSSIGKFGAWFFEGKVVDEQGNPMENVVVYTESGFGTRITTDTDGIFEIAARESDHIIISHDGYRTQRIPVGRHSGALINVSMAVDDDYSTDLDEFVVTAAGPQRRITTTGAISNVEMKSLPSSAAEDANAGFSEFWIRGTSSFGADGGALILVDGVERNMNEVDEKDILTFKVLKDASATAIYGSKGANGVVLITTKSGQAKLEAEVQVRKNFDETAFFYPQLRTNERGEILITFTVPESNTAWRFRTFAHDREARNGRVEHTFVSRKELMVVPNMPRFLREGDKTSISAKVSNMSDGMLTGEVHIEFFNPLDNKTIDLPIHNRKQPFAVDANRSVLVDWTFDVPKGMEFIGCRVVAGNSSFSDGEQHSLLVLPNRVLVTESMPINVNKAGETVHTLEKFKGNNSPTLDNHKLSFEFASNPAWYAVQALPVLSNPQNENAVNWFASYYVSTLGASLLKQYPQVAAMLEAWKIQGGDKETFVSKLQQNEELKNMLLSETPWLAEADSEVENMKRLSLLLDINNNAQKTREATEKLLELQNNAQGGWTWYEGMYPSRSITQYILHGYATLQLAAQVEYDDDIRSMQISGLRFIDDKILDDFNDLKKYNKDWEKINRISSNQLEYIYVRSFYRDIPIDQETREAERFYTKIASDNWKALGLYERSLLAVVAKRNGDMALAEKIVKSLEERAVVSDEKGMYWPNNREHVFMSMSAVSTHVFLMEALKENGATAEDLDLMKQWLIGQKHTQMWETTHATIDAIYALVSMGNNSLSADASSSAIKIGDRAVSMSDASLGTGYIKTSWSGSEITSDKAVVTINRTVEQPAYGAMYWQYYEDADKISGFKSNNLQIEKMLFKETVTSTKRSLSLITDENPLTVGDKVIMRLNVKVENDVEFVHIKDMRAPCFEPYQALSGVRMQDRAIYYQETKDASTNFFFDRLPKGTYVFEYPVLVNRTGTYSNGITTIQCMYAPEFRSHTDGLTVTVR